MVPPSIFFKSLLDEDEHLTWEALKEALLERYGGIGEGSIFEQLSALRQDGTVDEYIHQFEKLVAQVNRLPDEQYMGYFVHGLREGIRGRVRSLKALGPISRARLMTLARAVELELQEKRTGWSEPRFSGSRGSGGWGYGSRVSGGSGNGSQGRVRTQNGEWAFEKGARGSIDKGGANPGPKQELGGKGYGPRDRGIRNLSYQQIEERRKKGLCFKCGGPFHPRHQCPDRQLRIMITEEEDSDEGAVQVMQGEADEEDAEGELSVMSLHRLAAAKPSSFRTLKLKGEIQGVPILVLVDSGATHNFISHKLVKAMGWDVKLTTPLQIKLGDGYKAKTQGECKGVTLEIGRLQIAIDAMLFDLDGIDVVLGMAWLNTIGSMWVDWPQQVMRFIFNDQWIELKGDSSEGVYNSALQSLLAKPRMEIDGFFLTTEGHVMGVTQQETRDSSELTAVQMNRVQSLLDQFSAVFQEPRGLPPQRTHEHAIHLMEGQGPVNVRPYRYSHHHKNEIEKQVQELLQMGVIRPSQSAFSSPVILVKKKDGSWRMC